MTITTTIRGPSQEHGAKLLSNMPEDSNIPSLGDTDSSDDDQPTDDEDDADKCTTPPSEKNKRPSRGGWTPCGYRKLMRLITEAKGAASKPVVHYIKE
ncbi:hypothetical protein AAE478_009919 [Parahypoxylon ruwenzoriense]